MTGIDVDVAGRAGTFRLQARFRSDTPVTGIAGQSGAGKTTLLRMICGLVLPESGHVRVGNAEFFNHAKAINLPPDRRDIGMVFQDVRLFPHLRVSGNLGYGAKARGHVVETDEVHRVAELLEIENLLRRFPSKLSGGERQRVAIGRALLSRPKLLILDEPLTSVDGTRRDKIMPFILDYCAGLHIPVILVSHQAQDIARYCGGTVELKDGQTTSI
jgi:molybdate transport system ATP-binding protein